VYKSKLGPGNLLLRGFMAGLYIAVGGALATICSTGVADYLGPGMGKFIAGAFFPVGLIAIVLTGMELFTGDAMFMPKASLRKGDEVEVLGVINQGLVGKGDLTISVLSIEKS
jgi:formate/nitrite transporter FocA (FNT family)